MLTGEALYEGFCESLRNENVKSFTVIYQSDRFLHRHEPTPRECFFFKDTVNPDICGKEGKEWKVLNFDYKYIKHGMRPIEFSSILEIMEHGNSKDETAMIGQRIERAVKEEEEEMMMMNGFVYHPSIIIIRSDIPFSADRPIVSFDIPVGYEDNNRIDNRERVVNYKNYTAERAAEEEYRKETQRGREKQREIERDYRIGRSRSREKKGE